METLFYSKGVLPLPRFVIDTKGGFTGVLLVSFSVAILHYLAQEYSNFAGFGPDAATRAKAGSIVCWASKNLLK